MTQTMVQQPSESRLRRWWRNVYAVAQAMESSSYERLADRVDSLEERVRRLEALNAPADRMTRQP
jgi:hypothetical protein